MAIEFQVRAERFADIVKANLQTQLRHTCLSPSTTLLIDHLDLAADPARLTLVDETVHIEVAVNVFVVTRDSVLAAPNSQPAGADTPAAKVWIDLTFSAQANALQFQCVDATSEPPNPALDPILGPMIAAAIPTQTVMDLTTMLGNFGLGGGGTASVTLGGGVVTIQLDGSGPTVSHLQGDQEWGIFIDKVSLAAQAEAKLRPQLEKKLTGVQIASTWNPQGTVPRLEATFRGKYPLPDPLSAEITGLFVSSWSLVTMYLRVLQTSVAWEIGVDLGALVPAAVDAIAREKVAEELNKPSSNKTITGPRSFTTDQWLPEIAFGSSRLNYGSVLASSEGMTVGGSVQLPKAASTSTVSSSVTPFGRPFRVTVCSLLAKSGSGDPSPIVRPSEVAANADAWLEDCGHLCGVEIVSPGEWLRPYVFLQRTEEDDTQQISLLVPSITALQIVEPVQLLVHTTRGQRLLQWAPPPPVEIVDGNVVNAITSHIDDCLKLPPGWDDISQIEWGKEQELINPDFTENWTSHVGKEEIISIQVVTVNGLQAGELIQSRSPTHSIVVTANQDGVAIIPILLGIREGVARGSITSLQGSDLVRNATIQSAVFARQAVVASFADAALQGQLLGNRFGVDAQMTTVAERWDALPGDVHDSVRKSIPLVAEVYDIPGFPDLAIKVAEMNDGRKVLVDAGAKDGPQVVGTFEGPIGHLDHQPGWATISRSNDMMMFNAMRSDETPILAPGAVGSRMRGFR